MPGSTELTVNGSTHQVAAEPARSLLTVLREEIGLTGAKYPARRGRGPRAGAAFRPACRRLLLPSAHAGC